MRRKDLSSEIRIKIAAEVIISQDDYGKVSEIAKHYNVSRQFVYELINDFKRHMDSIFKKSLKSIESPYSLDRHILLMRFEGKSSLASISAILQSLGMQYNSQGYVSELLTKYGKLISE